MGKYRLYRVRDGKKIQHYYFTLSAANGKVICVSETYTSLFACQNGIRSIQKNANSPIEEMK